jgi:hypothetical protein
MNRQLAKTSAVVTVVAGIGLMLAAFLPWASIAFFGIHKNGIDGDGALTALIGGGVAALGLVAAFNPSKVIAGLVFAGSVAALAIVYYDIWDVNRRGLTVESGLYASFLAVTVAGVAAAMHGAALVE